MLCGFVNWEVGEEAAGISIRKRGCQGTEEV